MSACTGSRTSGEEGTIFHVGMNESWIFYWHVRSLMARWHFAWLIHSFLHSLYPHKWRPPLQYWFIYSRVPSAPNSEWVAYIPSHRHMMEKLKLKLQSPVVIFPSCLPLIDGPFHRLRCMVELWRGLWLRYYWLYCNERFHTNTCQSDMF